MAVIGAFICMFILTAIALYPAYRRMRFVRASSDLLEVADTLERVASEKNAQDDPAVVNCCAMARSLATNLYVITPLSLLAMAKYSGHLMSSGTDSERGDPGIKPNVDAATIAATHRVFSYAYYESPAGFLVLAYLVLFRMTKKSQVIANIPAALSFNGNRKVAHC